MSKINSVSGSFRITMQNEEDYYKHWIDNQTQEQFGYSDVQAGLARGENPIKLLRQHKGIEPEEMAAALEVGLPVYLGMEAGSQISTDRLKSICWYMDVSPLEFIPPKVTQTDGYLVNALMDAHNNPHQWPHDSEEMREEISKKLEWLAAPTLTYYYMNFKNKATQSGNQKKNSMLTDILDKILANDGNPYFHPHGATGYISDELQKLKRDIFKREITVRHHTKTLGQKDASVNKVGKRIFKSKWADVRAMMDRCYSRREQKDMLHFLMHEVPKPPRTLSAPAKESDFRELVKVFAKYKTAEIFENTKSQYEAETERLKDNRDGIKDFKKKSASFLRAYDNRQKILIDAWGIGKPMGNPNHPNFVHPLVRGKTRAISLLPR